jgi:acyl dehydratase
MVMDSNSGRYFEDYIIGVEGEVGSVSISEAEIIDFANKYDPQDFHTDPEKAATGPFGGLIASGWHTIAVVMRLLVDRYLDSASSLGSPGIDELRWLAPVRPGDILTVRAEVFDARRSNSKPDRGLIHTSVKVCNQDSVMVMTMKAINVVACRRPQMT